MTCLGSHMGSEVEPVTPMTPMSPLESKLSGASLCLLQKHAQGSQGSAWCSCVAAEPDQGAQTRTVMQE